MKTRRARLHRASGSTRIAKLYLEQLTVSSEEQLHNVRQTLAEEFDCGRCRKSL